MMHTKLFMENQVTSASREPAPWLTIKFQQHFGKVRQTALTRCGEVGVLE